MTIQINLKLDSDQTQFAGSKFQSMQYSFHKYCKAKLSIGIKFPFISVLKTNHLTIS